MGLGDVRRVPRCGRPPADGHQLRGTERAAVTDAMGALAVESRVPMTFGVGAGSRLEQMLRLVDTTAAEGGRMFGQTHSRGISVVLSFLSRTPFDRLPLWSEVRALPP